MATKIAGLRHPLAIGARNHLIQLLGHVGITRVMPGVASMLDVGYPDSPVVTESHVCWLSRGPRSGERAPDALGLLAVGHSEPQHLFSLWKGDARHQLLVFGDSPNKKFPASPLYSITRIVRQGSPADGVVVDTAGHAHEVYAAEKEGSCYLVRPDGIIAFRCGESTATALSEYLARWYHTE